MRDYPSLHFDIYSNKGTIASLYVVLQCTVFSNDLYIKMSV